MSEIPKAYEPQSVEDKWYDFWMKQGCFTADPARVSEQRPAYSIVIPPPNVTGMLHMGHVLNNTIWRAALVSPVLFDSIARPQFAGALGRLHSSLLPLGLAAPAADPTYGSILK